MAKQKSFNPADAFRKAQRAKELKKNKESRKAARESQTVKRDTRDLEDEIRNLKALPKLSEGHKARLTEVEKELDYVIKTKEAYVKLHPEARDRVFKVHAPRSGPSAQGKEEEDGMSHLYDEQGRLRDPTRSVYYHEVYNPFGVPPPGMPYRERTPPPEPDSDDEDDDDEEEDSDDEIIMPSGPAPAHAEEDDSDDSDDIPLPAGPPPPRTLPSQMPQQRPPIYMTGPPAHPPAGMPTPWAPPLHGHAGAGPSRSRPPRGLPGIQDPLSDAPTQTYQGYRSARADLPARPTLDAEPGAASGIDGADLPPRPAPPPRKPLEEGAGTISAEPQLRDLRKEATAFVPRGVKRKAGAPGVVGGKNGVGQRINAAPGAGVRDEDGDEVKYTAGQTANGLMGVLKGVLAEPAKHAATSKGNGKQDLDDDYQKFLEGLGDIA